MAEIRIEKKKGMPLWAMLLALLLLLLLVWAVLAMRGEDRQEAPPDVALLGWSVAAQQAAPVVLLPLPETTFSPVPAARCA
jgi:hypothetical protein